MLRVLLVNDTNKQVGRLRAALIQAGCEIVEEVFCTHDSKKSC